VTVSRTLAAFALFSLLAMDRATALDADAVVAAAGPGFDHQALERGEIVWQGLAEHEQSERELMALMMVRVPAPLIEVVTALERDPALQMGRSLPVERPAQWDAVGELLAATLDSRERERLSGAAAERHYNLSTPELAQLRAAAEPARGWQQLLRQRVESYREHGPAGLPPYQRNGRPAVQPGEQLNEATASMGFLRRHFPDFVDDLANYPKRDPALREQFLFTLEHEGSRPLYVLKHRLMDVDAKRAIIAERQFYISHSLDTLQVIILCLPTADGGTQVAMLNQTYTGRVAGMGRAIAHRIGRQKVREKVQPLFEALRQRFAEPTVAHNP
jgi:hypothetical protein